MKKELVFLSKKFYEDHPLAEYAEFERKANRPYIVLLVKIEDRVWGIPFRSHIAHEYAFWTDREKRCGIDYSKAVVIDKEEYVIGRQRLVCAPASSMRFAVRSLISTEVLFLISTRTRRQDAAAIDAMPQCLSFQRFSITIFCKP